MASPAGSRGEAAETAEVLLEPLLEADGEGDEGSRDATAGAVPAEVERTPAQTLKVALVWVGLGAGVAASVAAMILNPVAAVLVMGGIAIANSPYTAFKEHRIVKLPALRTLSNELKLEANNLEEEVDFLSGEIDNNLAPSAARAASIEAQLKDIADERQFNVDKFVSLVKENEMIIAQMRDNLRQRIVQDVMGIVLSSDRDNDGRFSEFETKMLVLKISLALQEYGVEFDEGKFTKVMGSDPSVQKTIKIVKRLIPDLEDGGDDPEGEGGEDDETSELYDMFHMSGGGGSFGGSVSGSIGELTAGGSTTGGPTTGGPITGGPTVGGSTDRGSIMSVHSTLEGSQKLSLSVSKEPPRRRRTSPTQKPRKRDRFKQKFGRGEKSDPGSEERSRRKRDSVKAWLGAESS